MVQVPRDRLALWGQLAQTVRRAVQGLPVCKVSLGPRVQLGLKDLKDPLAHPETLELLEVRVPLVFRVLQGVRVWLVQQETQAYRGLLGRQVPLGPLALRGVLDLMEPQGLQVLLEAQGPWESQGRPV